MGHLWCIWTFDNKGTALQCLYFMHVCFATGKVACCTVLSSQLACGLALAYVAIHVQGLTLADE